MTTTAAVVDGDGLDERDVARLGVDLDDGDVTTERERPVGVEVDLGRPVARPARRSLRRRAAPAHARPRRNADHAEPAVVEHDDVVDARLRAGRRRAARASSSTTVDGFVHGAAGELQRTGAERADTVRHARGVGVHDAHVLERHAEHRRRDLRPRGLVALTVRDAAGHDGRRPVALDRAPSRTRRRGR